MAFISKDWRDPGKLWIKTDRGWEEKLVIDKMISDDSNSGSVDLLEAMQNALATAHQREVLVAGQLLQSNCCYDELRRAKQQRCYIEWELSKRRCRSRRGGGSGGAAAAAAAAAADGCGGGGDGAGGDGKARRHHRVVDEEERQGGVDDVQMDPPMSESSSGQESILVLKIKVRDRVQYIENKCQHRKDSLQDDAEGMKNDVQESISNANGESELDDANKGDHKENNCNGARKKQNHQVPGVANAESAVITSGGSGRVEAAEAAGNREEQQQPLSRQQPFVMPPPPHCYITVKNTREISGFNRLCEVLKRLDFRGAVWDQRRFNYICKLIELLTTRRLRTLTGGSQKMLLVLLEEVARSVRSSQQNTHVLRRLLGQLQDRLCCVVWGRQLGSAPLWRENTHRLSVIQAIATDIAMQPPGALVRPTFQDLPEDCVRAILLRLSSHTDLQCAGEAYSVMGRIIEERRIWRELCKFHWSEQQLHYIRQNYPHLQHRPTDWKSVYTRLKRSFGLREEYAVSLVLCKACHCLFWESLGHPCQAEEDPQWKERIRTNTNDHSNMVVTIPPHTFLSFFS